MRFTNKRWQPRHVKFEVTKERLTDAAGLGTLMEIFDKSPLSEGFKKCLPVRTHSRSHGSYRLGLTQLSSFLYGHDSIDDLKEFQTDPALEAIMRGETVAPRTMGDFLRDFDETHIKALNEYLTKMGWAIRGHLSEVLPEGKRPASAIHASIDTTFHEQSGKKMEGLAYNYDKKWGLDSQVVYDELGLSYGFQLRQGDVGNNVGSSEMIEQIFEGKKFADEKYLSGDSAFCNQECIRTCLRLGVKFTFTAHDGWTSWRSHIPEIDDWESWSWSKEELAAFERRKQTPPQIEQGRFLWYPNWAEGKIVLNVVVKRTWVTEGQDQGLFNEESAGGYWDHYGVVTNISLYWNTKQEVIQRPRPFYLAIITEETMQPLYKNPSFVHQKYVVEGLSIREIACEIFSSKEAVRNALRRFEIPIRESHMPHNGRISCPSYGTKLRSGRASPHVAEQQMIETIKDLRAQGLTLRKVAKILTNMGVPTKKRGKSWHPEMVKRILERVNRTN